MEWWSWLIVAVVTVLTIRIAVSLDLVKLLKMLLERRDRRRLARIQHECLHARVFPSGRGA